MHSIITACSGDEKNPTDIIFTELLGF